MVCGHGGDERIKYDPFRDAFMFERRGGPPWPPGC